MVKALVADMKFILQANFFVCHSLISQTLFSLFDIKLDASRNQETIDRVSHLSTVSIHFQMMLNNYLVKTYVLIATM